MLTHGAKQACTRDAAWPYLLSLRGACANGVAADQTGRPWVGEPDLGPGHILSRPGGLAGAWSCGKEEAGEAGQMGPVVTTEKRAGGSRTLLHGLFAGSRRGLLVPVLTCEGDGNARGQTALEGSGFPADSQTSGEWGLAMSALLSTGASSLKRGGGGKTPARGERGKARCATQGWEEDPIHEPISALRTPWSLT